MSRDRLPSADALVFAVAHREYLEMAREDLLSRVKAGGCVIDVKSVLDRDAVAARGLYLWCR